MRPINVSLDATTWEIAKKLPNFSKWIRSKLREHDAKNNHRLDDTRFLDRKRVKVTNDLIDFAKSTWLSTGKWPSWYNLKSGCPEDWIIDNEMVPIPGREEMPVRSLALEMEFIDHETNEI